MQGNNKKASNNSVLKIAGTQRGQWKVRTIVREDLIRNEDKISR